MKTAQEVINTLASLTVYRYIAMDENGQWVAYEYLPIIENGCYSWYGESYAEITIQIQPVEDWTQSLLEAQI